MPRTKRVDCSGPGLTRKGRGKGFSYHEEDGERVTDEATLERIRELAIPPAWKDVWICPVPNGHIQATGYDEAGRKQYLYHQSWRESRDREKFEEMTDFAKRLPRLRKRLRADLAEDSLTRKRVMSLAIGLLDLGLFRVGSERYENERRSYGLTTLKRRHMRIENGVAIFEYPSKSGQESVHRISHPDVMPTLKALKSLGGPRDRDLLIYKDPDSDEWRDLDPAEVNEYLRELIGGEASAKDFRTWNATVIAAVQLAAMEEDASKSKTARKRAINLAVRETARYLNNTPAVCRSSYIDPRVFDCFDSGVTIRSAMRRIESGNEPGTFAEREAIERAVVRLLSR